jgi:hypothetical protein
MKYIRFFVLAVVVLFALNLQASVRLDGLGSYFSNLVPDLETDSDRFPSYLMDYEMKMVQFSTVSVSTYSLPQNDINISILPLIGNFRVKIDLRAGSDETDSRIFLSEISSEGYEGEYNFNSNFLYYDRTSMNIKTTISYRLSNLILGCYISGGKAWKERLYANVEEDLGYQYEQKEVTLDHDENYSNFGVNLGWSGWSVTLDYKDSDIDFKEQYFRDRFWDNNYHHLSSSEHEIFVNKKSKAYEFSVLKEKLTNLSSSRIYMKFNNVMEELTMESNSVQYDSVYFNSADIETRLNEDSRNKIEELETYNGIIGLAKSIYGKSVDYHFGLKLIGAMNIADRDEYSYYLDLDEDIFPDSTIVELDTGEEDLVFEVNSKKLNLQIPVGLNCHISSKFDLYGGFGFELGYKILDYYKDKGQSSWKTSINKSMGISYKPLDQLELDVNFSNSLAYVNHWKANLKYYW